MTTPYHFTTSKIVLGSYKKGIGYSKLSMMCYVFLAILYLLFANCAEFLLLVSLFIIMTTK